MTVDTKSTGTIIFILVLSCLKTSMCYVFKCPYSHTSEWRLRAQIICNGSITTRYQCLFDELSQFTTKNHNFTEQCTENPDFLKQGKKYVIASKRRSNNCSVNTYQPLRFWSNSSDECEFVKTKCSEGGQIIYSDGLTDTDSTCRCDYRNGYAFINNPSKTCYCVPSKEDCSCYLKICTEKKKVSQDYICVDSKDEGRKQNCPPFLSQRNKEQTKISQEQSNTELRKPTIDKWNLVFVTVWIIVTIIIIIIIGTLLCVEKLPDYFFVQLKPLTNVTTRANISDKCIDIMWFQPLNVNVPIKKYEIQYTCDEWKTTNLSYADPGKVLLRISNIIPKKYYRFKACYICSNESHKDEIRSDQSNEELIFSDEPAAPKVMITVWENSNIIVSWLPPVDTLFETTGYKIQITKDNWVTLDVDINQSAQDALQFTMENVLEGKTYRFKIYSCTLSGICSIPLEHMCYTGSYCLIEVPIDQEFKKELNNRNDPEYIAKSNEIENKVDVLYDRGLKNGYQKVRDVTFKKGCIIAVIMLTSEGYFDEEILRDVIEKPVKSGRLGDLKTFHKGFSFTVMNRPKPPQGIKVVAENTYVLIKWEKTLKSLFKNENYRIEYTHDAWQTKKVKDFPDDIFEFKITDVMPATTYKCKLFTIVHDSIASNQSTEKEITTGDPLPLYNLKAVLLKSRHNSKYLMIKWDKPVFPSEKHIEKYMFTVNEKELEFKPESDCSYTWPIEDETKVYTFHLTVHGYNGTESKSDAITCNMRKPPLPPRNIRVENPNGIKLMWDHPHTPKVECIKHYTIYIKDDGRQPLEPVIVQSPQKSKLINNLKPNHRYTFEVSTCSTENFEGLASVPIESKTGDPLPPKDMKVNPTADGLELVWSKPEFPVEQYIEKYGVVMSSDDNPDTFFETEDTRFFFEGKVKPNTVYEFQCKTYSTNGHESQPSKKVSLNTTVGPH